MIYRFQPDTNLSLLRMSTGAFEMFEMTITESDNLHLTWSCNEGMKCRCDYNTENLCGIALRQCHGTMVSATPLDSLRIFSGIRMKFGKIAEDVAIEAEIFPQVGDDKLATVIDNILDGLSSNLSEELCRSLLLFASNFVMGRLRPRGEVAAFSEWGSVSEGFSILKDVNLIADSS